MRELLLITSAPPVKAGTGVSCGVLNEYWQKLARSGVLMWSVSLLSAKWTTSGPHPPGVWGPLH